MMTKLFRIFFITFFLFSTCLPLFCENGKWVIAGEKFQYAKGQKEGSVQKGTSEMIPSEILENLNRSLHRNVMPDEQLERIIYKLRTERQALYLQLSSEYKKRDSLLLNNYSDSKLRSMLNEQEKKISSLQKKINENLEQLKNETNLAEEKMKLISDQSFSNDSEAQLLGKFFRNIFSKDNSIIQVEQINYYHNDFTSLFIPSETASKEGPLSPEYEREAIAQGINALITGVISQYGDYISVSADLYQYPGAKILGSVMEVGSVQDLELITSSIAMQFLPLIISA